MRVTRCWGPARRRPAESDRQRPACGLLGRRKTGFRVRGSGFRRSNRRAAESRRVSAPPRLRGESLPIALPAVWRPDDRRADPRWPIRPAGLQALPPFHRVRSVARKGRCTMTTGNATGSSSLLPSDFPAGGRNRQSRRCRRPHRSFRRRSRNRGHRSGGHHRQLRRCDQAPRPPSPLSAMRTATPVSTMEYFRLRPGRTRRKRRGTIAVPLAGRGEGARAEKSRFWSCQLSIACCRRRRQLSTANCQPTTAAGHRPRPPNVDPGRSWCVAIGGEGAFMTPPAVKTGT